MSALVMTPTTAEVSRCVVRLTTCTWADSRGVHIRTSLTFLRRKSFGFNMLQEEIAATGAEHACASIINLSECADGVYELISTNERRDWESGHIDAYDMVLVPWAQPQ